uniref:SAM domain-containing protein n=1 Tax=Onchocerca volvulus TaxID=6282 RepID=A0A8R1Y3H2_ONCVO
MSNISFLDVLITANDEKLRDPEGYEAIAQLHHQMDDDQSGSIDRFESTDFLKEDMQLGGLDRAQRERAFHHNHDELITVDDLWEAWFASEERSWTTVDMVNWLENTVRLPQYATIFIEMEIDGRALPRMAVANSTYLLSDLGIKNSVHKQKLRLKALDVVLFGFSGGNASWLKDIILSILVIVLVTVLFVLKIQRTRSHMQMEQLTAKLSQLRSMQSNFEDIQQKFEEEQKRRQSTRGALESEQVETLKSQLMEAERLLENSGSAPLALQPLLRRTCELEVSYVGQQRMECIAEMREAIEHIDKLRKKQSSIVSSIKLATGASSGTDHIDSRIFALKFNRACMGSVNTMSIHYLLRARMEKISLAMSECHQRWTEIESLCGFPLVPTSATAEIMFPSAATNDVLSRTGSSSSFYRKSDLVGTTLAKNMALSSISGNNSSAIIETSSNISDRVLPAVCSYAHENFTPAGTRYLDSLNLQRHIHESVNESRPLKFAVDCSELLHRSASSGSFNKLRHLRSIADMQKSRNQRATSIIATINDDDGISVASNVNEIIAPTVPSPTTVTSHFSPFKQDLKLLKQNVSNVVLKSSSSNTKANGFMVIKEKNSTDISTISSNRKSKLRNLFHKTSKI